MMERYDITVLMRDNITLEFRNAIYREENWCVRIDTGDGIVRINKNGINKISMTVSE